jgi:two-component system CheB/CheR fusion protein
MTPTRLLAGLLDGRAALPLRGLRILLVEDSADSLHAMSLLLQLDGAEIGTAGCGARALDLLEREAFDLLISDIGMPGMSGYELVAEVRRRPALARLPAIALTGYDRGIDHARARDAGFDAHVAKPIQIKQLIDAIGALCPGRPAAIAPT